MPWTRKEVRYLMSKVSPLSSEQKTKMVGELHANPSLGHARKGSKALSAEAAARIRARVK
jgi:hypothetical protein